jgi:carboxylesterase
MASLKNAQYLQTHLGGLVDTLILDDSYHIVTLDQQRHLVAERAEHFAGWIATRYASQISGSSRAANSAAAE